MLPELNAKERLAKGVEASADGHEDVHDGMEASQGLLEVF
jgi:hypothetical protein